MITDKQIASFEMWASSKGIPTVVGKFGYECEQAMYWLKCFVELGEDKTEKEYFSGLQVLIAERRHRNKQKSTRPKRRAK